MVGDGGVEAVDVTAVRVFQRIRDRKREGWVTQRAVWTVWPGASCDLHRASASPVFLGGKGRGVRTDGDGVCHCREWG